jgi:hypothetical protein
MQNDDDMLKEPQEMNTVAPLEPARSLHLLMCSSELELLYVSSRLAAVTATQVATQRETPWCLGWGLGDRDDTNSCEKPYGVKSQTVLSTAAVTVRIGL